VDPFAELDLAGIQDERVRTCVILLLNLVEDLTGENAARRAEVQRLRDEINRLTGEQGQPPIQGNTPQPAPVPTDYSSERHRHVPPGWAKGTKTDRIRMDREQTVAGEPTTLPADAQFTGHADVVVQDIVLRTDTVLFHQEKYSSPSAGRTYLASLLAGYAGQFGPGLTALTIVLSCGANVSESKIVALYRRVGVLISAGQGSNLLIKDQARCHAEKAAVPAAGLASSPWQHLDDPSTRVNGQNQYCQVLGTPLYTSDQTTAAKDRQSILDVLRNGRLRQ